MAKSFNELKQFLLKEKEKYDFEKAVRTVYSRPKNKLTQTVKKAKHQAPSGLECFKDEYRTYSVKETNDYIQGTSYFENYQAMQGQDSYE